MHRLCLGKSLQQRPLESRLFLSLRSGGVRTSLAGNNQVSDTVFYMPARVIAAPDALRHLSRAAQFGKKALLITGKSFARQSGLLGRAQKLLADAGAQSILFDQVEPDPSVATVQAAAELGCTHNCDLVVGIGGGSAMDVAKAAAVLLRNPSPLNRYFGQEKLESPAAPVVCVPTTAGTASEVTRYSVIVDSQANAKKTIAAESIIPRLALLDAQLTVGLPADLTAQTGMDAFSHAVEAYLSTAGNLLSDCFCLQALQTITQALPGVLAEPKNIDLRHQMLLASMLAGLALNSAGTIINHGMAYALTISYGMGHGLANALLLPYSIAYIADDYPQKISRLCRILDCEDIEIALLDFNRRLNIPTSLAEAGVRRDDLHALAESCHLNCARALPRMKRQMNLHDYSKILQRAFC